MRLSYCLLLAAGLSVPALPAAAQQPMTMPGMSAPAGTAATAAGSTAPSPADSAMMAGMDKMSRAMAAAPMTGDADQDFAAMMMPHHQGAIDMAEAELKYGKDPELRRLARSIISAQRQ